MTLDEQIEIIKACKEGKDIQARARDSDNKWSDFYFTDPEYAIWRFDKYDYRVKPMENPDPMTFEMLTEWLARGNGLLYNESDNEKCYTHTFGYIESEKHHLVEQSYRVKRFGSDEELLPTKELYYKDCSPRKDDFDERFLECMDRFGLTRMVDSDFPSRSGVPCCDPRMKTSCNTEVKD